MVLRDKLSLFMSPATYAIAVINCIIPIFPDYGIMALTAFLQRMIDAIPPGITVSVKYKQEKPG